MTHTKPDNEKPVITDWILLLNYLGCLGTAAFIGLIIAVKEGLLSYGPFDQYESLITLGFVGAMVLALLARVAVFVLCEKSPYYKLARRFVWHNNDNLLVDLWFNCAVAAALIMFIIDVGLPDYVSISPLIIYGVLLVGLIVNLMLVGMPAWLAFVLGFSEIQATKLAKLLEENDGRVCLSCRHVLISKDDADPKCPECGVVDDSWLYNEIGFRRPL